MFCNKCGNEIIEGTNVCGYCGTPVNQGQNVNRQAGADQEPNRQNLYGETAPSYSGQASGSGSSYNYSNYSNYNGYSNQPPGSGAPAAPMDGGAVGLAITSLVLGIVALLVVCCVSVWWVSVLCAIAGIVFGVLSLGRHMGGKGMAIAGIVCSIVALVTEIVILIVGVGLFALIMSEFV